MLSFSSWVAAPRRMDSIIIYDPATASSHRSQAARRHSDPSAIRFCACQTAVRIRRLLGTGFYRARGSRSVAGHLSNVQELSKTRYCGTVATVIQIDDQMLLAQQ